MSESVSILIAADNQASAEFKRVGNDLDALGRRARQSSGAAVGSMDNFGRSVKEAGGKVKATTELAGAFARSFGGSQFGSFASEIAGLTEKVSAFSEVAKAGGAAGLALKGALVAGAAIAGLKIGEFVGNWAYQTERWQEELKKATDEASRLDALLEKRRAKGFAETREDIALTRDPAERERVANEKAAALQKEAEGLETRLQLAEQEVERRKADTAKGFNAFAEVVTGENGGQAALDNAERDLAKLREQHRALMEESQAVRELVGERAKSIEARRQENALADRSEAFIKGLEQEIELLKASDDERRKIEARNNAAPADQARVEELLAERDALKAMADFERAVEAEEEKAAQRKEQEAQRVEELQKRELQALEEKRILLEQGAEQAKRFRLEQEGMSKEAAADIAAREAELKKLEADKELNKKTEGIDRTPQQAVQGRLLTRGEGGDPVAKLVQQNAQQIAELKSMVSKFDSLIDATKANKIPLTVKKYNVP